VDKDYKCKLFPYTIEESLNAQAATDRPGWNITAFDLPKVWKKTKGEDVVVHVLDTGADLDHPDLEANLLPGKNFIRGGKKPHDDCEHGSHCIGIICAPQNGIGIIGVAPKCKVVPVKVLDQKGSGDMRVVAKAIRWSVDNGADIISMSLGCPNKVQQVRKAIKYAASKGIPVFCAGGNAGRTDHIFYPARYPETIAIGSIDEDLGRSNFSNTGKGLDFMAPGGKILSTVPNNGYKVMSGTCILKGSYIYTPFGPKKIENIIVNDLVFAFKNGEMVERKVAACHFRGYANVTKLIAGGRDVYTTNEHKILTLNVKEKDIEWVESQNLSQHHKLLMPKHFSNRINENLNNLFDLDFCWLLGFFVGDGWLSYTKRGTRVCFAVGDEPEIIEEVERIYKKTVGKTLTRSKDGGWDYDDSTKTAAIIESLGLNYYASEKTIPGWVWSLSKEKMISFINGYRQADGYLYKNPKYKHDYEAFECSSSDLVRRIAVFSDYMGWKHCTVSQRTRKMQPPNSKKEIERTFTALKVSRTSPKNGWSLLSKKPEKHLTKIGLDIENFFCASWKKKNILLNQSVYDLTVPDADCFVTQGIITHNSMACPFVVGVAALLKSYVKHNKTDLKLETVDDYRNALKKYTIPVSDKRYGGKKFFQGFGIVDPREFYEWIKNN